MNKPLMDVVLPRLAGPLYTQLQRFQSGELTEKQFTRLFEGLLQRQAKAAVPALIKRVADDAWIERKRFAGTDNASDPIDGGKDAALRALRQLAPDKLTDALRDAQKSKNAHVRAWATQELSRP